MVKVDFSKVVLKDIEGREMTADFRQQLGNHLYMQGRNIEECELGKKIYFAEDEVELSEKECQMVSQAIQAYSYVAREAINGMLNDKK